MTRRARGFTLIEVLLATALLAAGLALALGSLRAATVGAQRGEALAARSERERAVSQFLRRRIAGARPLAFAMDDTQGTSILFEGEPDGLRFVADLPDYLGRGGPHLHDIRVVADAAGELSLVVDFRVVQGSEAVPPASPAPPPETLVDGLSAVRLRYRGLDGERAAADWQARWEDTAFLPVQVELLLTDADGHAWAPLVVTLPLAATHLGVVTEEVP